MFDTRQQAGQMLGEAVAAVLAAWERPDPVVLALPRGGVPVAAEVARACSAPLDLIMVRKIGVPGHEELAAGAVVNGERPELVLNPEVMRLAKLTEADLAPIRDRALREIARRRAEYLAGRPPTELRGRDAIVVDDGIATGATVRAALKALRRKQPRRVILAVPVAPADTLETLRGLVDEVVCLEVPPRFLAVGAHYRDFRQVDDKDVALALSRQP